MFSALLGIILGVGFGCAVGGIAVAIRRARDARAEDRHRHDLELIDQRPTRALVCGFAYDGVGFLLIDPLRPHDPIFQAAWAWAGIVPLSIGEQVELEWWAIDCPVIIRRLQPEPKL